MDPIEEELTGMDRRSNRWHVGKEIPIAVMVTLLLQTFGIVWWAATLSGKLDSVMNQVKEMRDERYTKNDAQRDSALVQQRFIDIERRVDRIETNDRRNR
jgi:hypothetical protein